MDKAHNLRQICDIAATMRFVLQDVTLHSWD
ncbi:hypothetical protein ABIA96_005604 [Bradyrhizobium sp. LB11.1]